MKKRFLAFFTLLCIVVCSLTLFACSKNGSNDYVGTYYEYKNGQKTDFWIKLDKKEWSSSDEEGGRLEVKDGAVTAYSEFFGEEDVFFTGTVSDGVLTYSLIKGMEYKAYKDGAYKSNTDKPNTPDTPDTPDTPSVGKLEYFIASDNSYCAITGPGKYSGTELVIPSNIDGVPVTTIKANAFKKKNYTKVTIPGSVQQIELSAFQDCASLTSLTLENGIKTIASNAFKGCTALTEIIVPDSVQTISSGAFGGCSSLAKITIPYVGRKLLDVSDRTEEQLPFGYIFGKEEYEGSTPAQQTFYVNELAKQQGYGTFYLPETLTDVTITGGQIFYGAFMNCKKLKNINLPDTAEKIGDTAFRYCTGIETITIGDNYREIADNASADCVSLKTVNISKYVHSIGNYAFSGCTALENVNIADGNDRAEKIWIGVNAFAYCGLKSFTVPSNVTEIKDGTFRNNDNLISIDLGSNVTTIGEYALAECSSLTDVYIGKNAALFKDYFLSDGNQQKTIHFRGTEDEWNAIKKRTYWKSAAGKLTIIYSDNTRVCEHVFGDWNIKVAPTCTEDAIEYRVCKKCNSEETRTDAETALGHTLDNHCVCTRCGAVAHTLNNNCICEKCGIIAHTPNDDCVCKKCGAFEETAVSNALKVKTHIRNGSNVFFGTYPQVKVTDETLTSALTSLAGTLPTSNNSANWTSYGYYISGSVSNFMWYIDKEYNGEKYRGVYFTSYRPYYCGRSSSTSNTCQDNNGYYTSTVYWFKYEPIKWRILNESNGKALILADLAIDSQQFDTYNNNYANSTIRAWLNNEFYNTAFTSLQKGLIAVTNVDNSVSSTGYSSNGFACANTNDNVFLLSYKEVSTYLTSSSERQMKSSDYAKSQGCWQSTDSRYKGNYWWWLRSPYKGYAFNARFVGSDGNIDSDHDVEGTDAGVLPALVIRLS